MLVMKFGGTSVGNGERILNVARIVLDQQALQPVVITSAMTKVTDTLLQLHAIAASGDGETAHQQLEALCQRHVDAAEVIDVKNDWSHLLHQFTVLEHDVEAAVSNRDGSIQMRDRISSWGERLAVILVTGAIDALGGKGGCWDLPWIVTDDHFGEATPLAEPTRKLAKSALEQAQAEDAILVLPGFIGQTATPDESITTLGRGGSDYSATLLAVALEAKMCWIYTDVDGIFTADPRVVPTAQVLPSVSYATAGRLAVCGAKVLHSRSVSPASRSRVELRVRNTFKPDNPGTIIIAAPAEQRSRPQAVAGRRHVSVLNLLGSGLPEIPNLFGRMTRAIVDVGVEIVSAAHPVLGFDPQIVIDSIDQERAVAALRAEFTVEIEDAGFIDDISVAEDRALCTLVGDNLWRTVIEQTQRALAAEGITPQGQAASAAAITFILMDDELDQAIRRIHVDVIEPALREALQRAARPYGSGQWAAGGRQQRRRSTLDQH